MMSILKKSSDSRVKVQGRVDSSNASLFEKQLMSAISGKSLTIDAEELAYISSAGLRVLLKVKKTLDAELELINVNDEVFEILEMTGFTAFLTVRKDCRRISADGPSTAVQAPPSTFLTDCEDCRKISVDGLSIVVQAPTSTIYRIDADTVVKVFSPVFTYAMVQSEMAKAKTAFVNGIPTAIYYDVVKVGERYGVVSEALEAEILTNCIREYPQRREEYIRMFANEVREMHQKEIACEHYTSALATTMEALPYMKGRIFTDEEYAKARAVLEIIPVRKTFIHGDCNIDNVMLQDDKLIFVDFSCAGYGHPIFDMMSMYLTAACHEGLQFAYLTAEEARHLWEVFLSTYLQTEDPEVLAKVEEQVAAFSSTRVLAGLMRFPDMLTPEEIAINKAKIFEYYDKGIEPLCF